MGAHVDPGNSSTTPLGPNQEFVGQWTEVLLYTSVTVMFATDNDPDTTTGLRFEWSSDGINVDSELDPMIRSSDYVFGSDPIRGVAHSAVQARFFRVRYKNLFFGTQTFFRLQTLLSDGRPTGHLRRVASAEMRPGELAQATRTMLFAKTEGGTPASLLLPVLRTNGGRLHVRGNPRSQANRSSVSASATSVLVAAGDAGGFQLGGRSIHNDTTKGTLFIRSAVAASLSDFQWKVPPGHTWVEPNDWAQNFDALHGIWDVADGTAHVTTWSLQLS